MQKVIIKMGQEPTGRDPIAAAMWGRTRSQVFRDKRKVIARKAKHKASAYEGW